MSGTYKIENQEKGRVKPASKPASPAKKQAAESVKSPQQAINQETIKQMQQTAGNKAVQRMIQRRAVDDGGVVDEETTNTINSSRGQGSALDDSIATKAGAVMGQDFSNVTVHTDKTADQLNQNVNAKAFTTGSDIYFSEGAYNPNSQEGQHLIAHELTHVVQQGASAGTVQTKMTVNDPNDQYEAEADHVADQVVAQPDMQRQEEEEMMMGKWIQREEAAEEEEMMMGKWLQREEAGEEEEMMMGKWIQREEAAPEEEEMMMGKWLQREEMPAEDEELSA